MKYKRTLLVILCISLFIGVKFSIAFLYRITSNNNTFIKGVVKSSVVETFNNNIKSNVKIYNDGNVDEYIRVFINVYYKDESGLIIGKNPIKDIDYTLQLSSSSNWVYNNTDGFYYYKKPVKPDSYTDVLINEAKCLTTNDDRALHIDIYSQAIQAKPIDAVIDAWGVALNATEITFGGQS